MELIAALVATFNPPAQSYAPDFIADVYCAACRDRQSRPQRLAIVTHAGAGKPTVAVYSTRRVSARAATVPKGGTIDPREPTVRNLTLKQREYGLPMRLTGGQSRTKLTLLAMNPPHTWKAYIACPNPKCDDPRPLHVGNVLRQALARKARTKTGDLRIPTWA